MNPPTSHNHHDHGASPTERALALTSFRAIERLLLSNAAIFIARTSKSWPQDEPRGASCFAMR